MACHSHHVHQYITDDTRKLVKYQYITDDTRKLVNRQYITDENWSNNAGNAGLSLWVMVDVCSMFMLLFLYHAFFSFHSDWYSFHLVTISHPSQLVSSESKTSTIYAFLIGVFNQFDQNSRTFTLCSSPNPSSHEATIG